MPFLDVIVDRLNNNWVNALDCIRPARAFGIAETMLINKEDNADGKIIRYPAMIDDRGEVVMIDINDDYAITLYHKIDSIQNGIDKKQAFGDSYGKELEIANMSLLCFAFRTKVLKPAYWIEAILKDAMPEQSKMQYIQTSAYSPGVTTFDKITLLAREYQEIALNYPELIAFEMKYKIESTWKKGCFLNNNGC